jgi:hypothetical protein
MIVFPHKFPFLGRFSKLYKRFTVLSSATQEVLDIYQDKAGSGREFIYLPLPAQDNTEIQ